jgi:hypothetical protein
MGIAQMRKKSERFPLRNIEGFPLRRHYDDFDDGSPLSYIRGSMKPIR